MPQQSVFTRLRHGDFQPFNGQRIFGADINKALIGADCVTGNRHGFQNGVRIAFKGTAVHIRARVTFISVADDVLDVALHLFREIPLHPRREPRAAAAAQTGDLHFFDHLIRRHFKQDFFQCGVTVAGDVLINFFGID